MYSLSRTLVVRFSVTIFVALVLIALWAYLGTQRILHEQLDQGIRVAYQQQIASLAAGRTLPVHPGAVDFVQFSTTVNRFVAVRSDNGAVIETNTPLAGALPFDSAAFARALAGDEGWATLAWQRGRVRSLFAPAPGSRNGDRAVVQIAAALGPTGSASRTVLLLMIGTVVLGTTATVIGAGWLARVAVAPVEQITEQARTIRPGTTGNRITTHADVLEYHGLIDVLNRMLERLDRGLESERRIIADVGHDLRTPITAMRGEIEVALRAARSSDEYRRTLHSILEEVDHLGSIAQALVLLARLEAGELVPERRRTDLAEAVEAAARRARARSGTHEIVSHHEGDTVVRADEQMLSVVVDHLLDNAVRHTPDGTMVKAFVVGDGRRVTIIMEDSGPGVSRDLLPFLFERFYRADSARGRGGAGLGLTIARAIAEAHGGSIAADRGTHGGLRITINLPRDPSARAR